MSSSKSDISYSSIDSTAQNYESKIIAGWEKLYKLKRKKLYSLLSDFYCGDSVLELGCGDGESTKHLFKDFSSVDVVDASTEQLQKLEEMFDNVKTFCSYFEDFKPNKTYSTIVGTHILEHLDNPSQLLDNCFDWLNPGGRLLISVPNALSIHRLVGVKLNMINSPYDLNDQDKLLGHRRVFDKSSMIDLINQSNFKLLHFTGLMFKPISNRQIELNWPDELIEAFFQLGFDFPEYCSEIIFVLEK